MARTPETSRRTLLLGAAAVAGAAAGLTTTTGGGALAGPAGSTTGGLPTLAPLPPGTPVRRHFRPQEQRFAGYLAILPDMTNDIADDPADPDTYGFMGGGWWRSPNVSYNARVQEHVYTLSWFLASRRLWNPYTGDPALEARLDIALGHYLALQHPDGSWPEYNPDERSKAATGFGMGYLAKALLQLRNAARLPARQQQIEAALRAGMGWFLDPATPIWGSGGPVPYANQNAAGLAASAMALTLFSDDLLERQLAERIEYLATNGQSPAGFFYEPTGMDIDYNFEVMLPEIAEIYALSGDRTVLDMARRFTEWFGYNLLREPDGSGWLTWYAMSSRTSRSYYDDIVADPDRTNLGSLFVPEIPDLGAFFTAQEDRAETRREWAHGPGPAPGLAKQATSPRIIAHAEYGEALPSRRAKRQALRQLPYLRSGDFATVRRDTARNQDYLYVRQPAWYFGGFFGTRPSSLVRGGTGFLWHPQAGTVVHAGQTNQNSWASVLPAGTSDANSNLDRTYQIGDRDWDGTEQALLGAPLLVRYQLPDGRILTDLTIAQTAVTRTVRAVFPVTEQVPLVLHPDDDVHFTDGTPVTYANDTAATATALIIRRGRVIIRIDWAQPLAATVSATDTTYLRDARRRIHLLRIPHAGTLSTTISVR
ncbi:hypothetical protein [Micromonospora sp. NBC_01813]|uniref:hypothetical protein n=1 Tax=Micromonospora sp. NBC_01813 TaxID=2975988 RepID=UPI002DDB0C8A|nr:hypothetical protein [Micromonospora sp. NBC_01813]WSA11095.1 hypothetical protein OG958_10170 [Micromonospora sp. NBC_01813]